MKDNVNLNSTRKSLIILTATFFTLLLFLWSIAQSRVGHADSRQQASDPIPTSSVRIMPLQPPEQSASALRSTPERIDAALAAGEITAAERLTYLAYAIYAPDRLPPQFIGNAPWHGTTYVEEIQAALAVQSSGLDSTLGDLVAHAGFCNQPGNFANQITDTHFQVEYNDIRGRLLITDYLTALDFSYDVQVDQFGWSPPYHEPGQTQIRVQIADLADNLYGYALRRHEISRDGNGVRRWASCLALNNDYRWNLFNSELESLRATVAHELNHTIQSSYGDTIPTKAKMWYESTATWMEKEVYPDIDANLVFLWPNFNSCLRSYKNPLTGNPDYTNWLFFRYITEHNGGNAIPGGGEEIIERFWEEIGLGKEPLDALEIGLGTKAVTLDDAYHDYAIASRFMLSCPQDAPYCYEDAAKYINFRNATTNKGTIATVGEGYSGLIQDNYAMTWIGLPTSDDPYDITLENRGPSGELRATIVALTTDGLKRQPLPNVVGNNRSVTLQNYQPPADASHIVAIITNQGTSPLASNHCISRPFHLSTKERSNPPPQPPACPIAPNLLQAAGQQGTRLDATIYGLSVVSGTEQAGITTIEPFVSINADGEMAFVGRLGRNDTAIYHAPTPAKLTEIAYGSGTARRFTPAVQINDSGSIVSTDSQAGSPSTLTGVRLWSTRPGESDELVASGQFQNGGRDFDAVFAFPTVNNNGEVLFSALAQHQSDPGNHECDERCIAKRKPNDDGFHTSRVSVPVRPLLADDGRAILKYGELADDPIRLYDRELRNYTEIANTEMGFTNMGRNPGISDDGKLIAFYGELSLSGAQAISTTAGPGIFAAVAVNGTWRITRLAGIANNGQLDPGERWLDNNQNGVLDPGEDQGPFVTFRRDARIGIAADLTRPTCGVLVAAYLAEDTTGKVGLYTSQVQANVENAQFSVSAIVTIATAEQELPQVNAKITNLELYDPLNQQGQIAFWAALDNGQHAVVRAEPARRPVLVVPGVVGSLGRNFEQWMMTRYSHPSDLVIDPLLNAYDDLLQTLENAGYCRGANCDYENLFAAPYDWRLPNGPIDGNFDGTISGLSGASITDNDYRYGIDYLGYWLRQVAERWESRFPGVPLETVDVIAHSNGGLVTRVYIQSDAYGDTFTSSDGKQLTLPKINQLVLIGVPNRGAAKAWNPLHDDWASDASYRIVFANVLRYPWEQVTDKGRTIGGPDRTISRASLIGRDGKPDPKRFIVDYAPTARFFVATYPFLDDGNGIEHVNDRPAVRNNLVLDLNAGYDLLPQADPNTFVQRIVGDTLVVYGDGTVTPIMVEKREGDLLSLLNPPCIVSVVEFGCTLPEFGDIWYVEESRSAGDGTVPAISAAGQFDGTPGVTLLPMRDGVGGNTAGSVEHTGLVSNPDVQRRILETLAINPDLVALSTDLLRGPASALWDASPHMAAGIFSLDPVEGFLVDAQGRRLGYSAATGPVTEIPESVWLGETNGIGWFFDDLEGPYTVELIGLDEPYTVTAYLEEPGGNMALSYGGMVADGFLGMGETVTFTVPAFLTYTVDTPRVPGGDDVVTPTPTATPPESGQSNALYLPIVMDGGGSNRGASATPTPIRSMTTTQRPTVTPTATP